jgi:hypothetical protein
VFLSLRSPSAQLVAWTAVLAILSAIGIYIVRRFRDSTEDTETSSTLLTKFQESRHRGDLNEAEFRTIKTILAERMQAEIKQEDDSS